MSQSINLSWHSATAAMRRLVERFAAYEPADGWYSAGQLPALDQSDYATILQAAPEALSEVEFPVGLLADLLVSPNGVNSGRLVRALSRVLEPVLRHKLLAALIDYADARAGAARWPRSAQLIASTQ